MATQSPKVTSFQARSISSRFSLGPIDLLGVLLVLLPLVVGGVHLWTRIGVAGVLLVAFLWSQIRLSGTKTRQGIRWPELVFFALVGWLVLQWLPWPLPLLEWIAPRSASTRTELAAILGQSPPTWLPWTLDQGRTAAALMEFLSWFLVFSIAAAMGSRGFGGRTRKRFLDYVELGGVLAAMVGIFHTSMKMDLLYGFYPPSIELKHLSFRGPFVNPNHMAALMLIVAHVSLGRWLDADGRRERLRHGLIWCVMGTTLFLTASMTNLLLLTLGHIGVLVWVLKERDFAPIHYFRMGLAVCAFLGLVASMLHLLGVTQWQREWIWTWQGTHGISPRLLLNRWQIGLEVLSNQTLLGSGAGTFPLSAAFITEHWRHGYFSYAHNFFFQWASEWGLPMSVLVLSTGFFLWLKRVRAGSSTWVERLILIGLFLIAIQNLVDFSLHVPGVGYIVFALAGYLVRRDVKSQETKEQGTSQHPPHVVLRGAMAMLLVCACVASAHADAQGLERSLRERINAEEKCQLDIVQDVQAHPADFSLLGLAALCGREGGSRFAQPISEHALGQAPWNPEALEIAARLSIEADQLPLAVQHLGALLRQSEMTPRAKKMTIDLVLTHKDKPGLFRGFVSLGAQEAMALYDYLSRTREREFAERLLGWAAGAYPQALSVKKELARKWRKEPKKLEKLSVELLGNAAEQPDPDDGARMLQFGYELQARLHSQRKEHFEAWHLYQAAAKAHGIEAFRLYLLAIDEILMVGQWQKARDILRKQLEPHLSRRKLELYVGFYERKSLVAWQAGKKFEAIRFIKRAIGGAPKKSKLYKILANYLEETGSHIGAKMARERAQALKK